MQNQFKKIQHSVKRLYKLQESHLEAFKAIDLPDDLDKHYNELASEFDCLTERIKKFINPEEIENRNITESMLVSLNKSINALLEQNRALETKVRELKNTMEKDLKELSRGKKAVGSYRSNTSASADPMAISITF